MELQIGKAEHILTAWSIPRRRLIHWIDEGLIRARNRRQGKGSIRLLTEESLLDAFLVANTVEVLPSVCLRSALEAARRQYATWLRTQPDRVTFECYLRHNRRVSVNFPLSEALRVIDALREQSGVSEVHRGRPARNWRREFEEDLAEIGRALRQAEASRPSLREEVATYRRRKMERSREVRVTVPT